MNEVTFQYRWCRNTKPNSKGEYYLKLRVKVGQSDAWIPAFYLDKKCWDKQREAVTNAHPDHILLNSRLINLKKTYSDFQLKMIGLKGFVTLDDFKRFAKGQNKYADTFNSYFNQLVSNQRNLADNTIENAMNVLRHLNKYNNSIQFSDVTPTMIREFNNFLSKQGFTVSSINQYHVRLQGVIKQALRDKIITENPYQHFKLAKAKKVNKDYLLDDELNKLEALELEGDAKVARDMFLFSSYTGLRASDVKAINQSNIVVSGDETYLVRTMKKTKERVELPLSTLFGGKALGILSQYPDFFPDWNQQKINRLLKAILDKAGIKKNISFHCSRHGYFSKLGRETNDLLMIMDLNSVSMSTARRYTKSTRESIREKLKHVNW